MLPLSSSRIAQASSRFWRHELIHIEQSVPIFSRHGNRMVAVNPALVRSVETQTSGGCKIIFDQHHELMVDASFYEIIKALWGTSPMSEIKELTVSREPG